ncbi:aspartate ammonia-lyase [Candidatus Woesearchaeota archaeon]|nr:aspartate ammonia-lyase [Candidatus Woesearchaeota archaeon]
MKRTERDAIGELDVDSDAYYGIFTERARRNFQISGIKARPAFIRALAIIKKSAARANMQLGLLDRGMAAAIMESADEIIGGRHSGQFPLDVFQAGAGTPFNMNMNEVMANLAIEKLGGKKGQYGIVHPNNHVNMAQSSNDVIPTAARLAVLFEIDALIAELRLLEKEFGAKAEQHKRTLKVGRTHLQDAVPMTFGQVFSSYSSSIGKCTGRLQQAKGELQELGIGGTAVGTGINTHPKFKSLIIGELKKETGLDLRIAQDTIETTWSHSAFLNFSSSLRTLSAELIKICDDLMLLNSGPKAGIGELTLPEVEPGSSIMPGKVNPSITECLKMICFQVIGNDLAIMESSKAGNLELNVNTPLIMHDLLWSIGMLANGARMLRECCIEGIAVNKERAESLLESSLVLGTALNPYFGYEIVAEIVKISLQQNKPLREVIVENRLVSDNDLGRILDSRQMVSPNESDRELAARIKSSESLQRFRELVMQTRNKV